MSYPLHQGFLMQWITIQDFISEAAYAAPPVPAGVSFINRRYFFVTAFLITDFFTVGFFAAGLVALAADFLTAVFGAAGLT